MLDQAALDAVRQWKYTLKARASFQPSASGQNSFQRRPVDVAPAHHTHDLLSGQPTGDLDGCHEGCGAGALGKVVRRPEREPDALLQLLFAQDDDVVELPLQNAERQVEGDSGRDPFSEG